MVHLPTSLLKCPEEIYKVNLLKNIRGCPEEIQIGNCPGDLTV